LIMSEGEHMEEVSKFFTSFEKILMGRKTYEEALGQGTGGAYPGMKT